MLINNFETWQRLKIDNTPDDELVECPDCQGEGNISVECESFGNESEHTCGLCDGEGRVKVGDLGHDEICRLAAFDKSAYHHEVIADLERLAFWTGENRLDLLLDHGYTVITVIASRTEKVVIQ